MSHFSTLVILPAGTEEDESQEAAELLLGKYSEHIRVEPYPEVCWCKGRPLRQAAHAFRLRFHPVPNIDTPLQIKYDWCQMYDDFKESRRHLYPVFDPECEDCGGTGVSITTYNPLSKWDYWVRCSAGRFGFWGELETQFDSEDFATDVALIAERTLEHKEYLPGMAWEADPVTVDRMYRPFAFVTPDGEWHERGKMGWWATVSGEMTDAEWETACRELYLKYAGHPALLVDCHI